MSGCAGPDSQSLIDLPVHIELASQKDGRIERVDNHRAEPQPISALNHMERQRKG